MAPWEDYLRKIYYDPSHPASFAGPQKLYKVVKNERKFDIGMYRIRKFLHNQEAYSLHKPVRRRFHRNHVISSGMDDLWMADLMDMVKFKDWNNGYKYVLLVIDTFSKYVWLRPLKNKSGQDVKSAFQDIFRNDGRIPKRITTDKGQEFRAKVVQDLMKKNNIKYFPTHNETKASTSERAILTIKTRLSRYFTYRDDYTYLPVLQKIADNYNRTYHRTIGTQPAEVKPANEEEIRISTYLSQNRGSHNKMPKKRSFKYRLNQYVRVSHLKGAFTRAYDQTYSGEIFQIYKRYYRGNIPVYRLKDLQGEEVKGTWYESELLPLEVDLDKMSFKVDKILKRRGKEKNKEVLVSWKHYPKKFNQWIPERDLK